MTYKTIVAHVDQSGHGVKMGVLQETTGQDSGSALLSPAADVNADLLVMGCHAHLCFLEVLRAAPRARYWNR